MNTKEKRSPRNTTREVRDNPLLGLFVAMGGGEGILAQESQGQHSFVTSDTLPSRIESCGSYDAKAILEAAGVKFLGLVEGDNLFQYVELPSGWKKMPTDHSMWSNLVDDKGRNRASIFYKAAFYDRDAHMSLSRRFNLSFDYERFDREKVGVSNVVDGGKVIYSTDPIPGEKSYEVRKKSDEIAIRWLHENYPDWESPSAYWD